MKNKRTLTIYNLISLILISALLSSCAVKKSALVKPVDIELVTDADYLAYISIRLAGLKTFQGAGEFKISNSEKSDSATCALLIKRPDGMRLESYSTFGQAVFFFASKGDSFSMFVPSESAYLTGENTVENLKKVLPLNITIDEFSNYLIGNFKKNEDDSVVVKYLEDKKEYKIYLYSDEQTVLWFDPERLVITRCAVYNLSGEMKTLVTYSDFKDVGGMRFPMSILIKFIDIDARIEIDYDDVSVNEEIEDKMFMLDVPEKAEFISLDEDKAF